MKIAILVEEWGTPWNEGYKNLAKYIFKMLENYVNAGVIPLYKANLSILKTFDLIYVFNYPMTYKTFLQFATLRRPVVKEVAKKELDVDALSVIKNFINVNFVWNAIFVTTPNLKNEILRLNTNRRPIFYLPPPIPVDYFKGMDKSLSRKMLNLDQQGFYIGYTGRLNEFRRLNIVFDAFKILGSGNEGVKLVLSITNSNTSNLLSAIRNLDSLMRVKIVKIEDVRIFYSALDLLIYPVERRGAIEPPLTVLEAMSCGTIVAALRNEAMSTVIKNGVNGFLFSDPYELVEIIRSITKEQVPIDKISRNARKTIVTMFNPERLRSLYMKALKTVLDLNA